jgi:hypothetical protein
MSNLLSTTTSSESEFRAPPAAGTITRYSPPRIARKQSQFGYDSPDVSVEKRFAGRPAEPPCFRIAAGWPGSALPPVALCWYLATHEPVQAATDGH